MGSPGSYLADCAISAENSISVVLVHRSWARNEGSGANFELCHNRTFGSHRLDLQNHP